MTLSSLLALYDFLLKLFKILRLCSNLERESKAEQKIHTGVEAPSSLLSLSLTSQEVYAEVSHHLTCFRSHFGPASGSGWPSCAAYCENPHRLGRKKWFIIELASLLFVFEISLSFQPNAWFAWVLAVTLPAPSLGVLFLSLSPPPALPLLSSLWETLEKKKGSEKSGCQWAASSRVCV